MRHPQTWTQIETLFHQVLALPEEDRQAFLKQACRNEKIYQELLVLLSVDRRATSLASPIHPIQRHLSAGSKLGPYEIHNVIAQGGMGIVYEATREDGQYHKKVAIKCLKEYFSPERAQRFFFEKEVLANLDHPHICKIIDAGISEEGQPYFVMDFIDGQNLLEYSRNQNLEKRLALFTQVCDAVHYAHQNLVIHRDLKPSNILVDQSGKVFLLDFGISKIIGNPTDLTQTMAPVMTPQYASPEQIAGETLSLASDIYSLGLILFELLTHQPPFKRSSSNYHSLTSNPMTWHIPLPSESLEKLRLPASALKKWKRTLRQDLDWVCLKALSREPEKRYASAHSLKQEIIRFTQGDPVKARKQHRLYTLHKFISKHRNVFAYGLLFLVSLVGLGLYHTQKLSRERNYAVAQARKKEQMVLFLSGILQVNNPQAEMGKTLTRQEILDIASQRLAVDFATEPEIKAEMELVLSQIYFQNGQYQESLANAKTAIAFFENALAYDPQKCADGYLQASNSQIRLNQLDEASKSLQSAHKHHQGSPDLILFHLLLNEALITVYGHDLSRSEELLNRAQVVLDACASCPPKEQGVLFHIRAVLNLLSGNLDSAETHYKKGMVIFKQEKHSALSLSGDMLGLADLLMTKGRLEEAEPLIKESLKIRLEFLEADHPNLGQSYHFLGLIHRQKGRYSEAESAYRKALQIRLLHLGNDHHETNLTQSNLAVVLRNLGKFEEAESLYLATLDNNLNNNGLLHWRTGITFNNLGRLYQDVGREEEAFQMFCQALDIFSSIYPGDHHYTGIAHLNLGNNLIDTHPDLARQEFSAASAIFEKKLGAQHFRVGQVCLGLAKLAWKERQIPLAKTWLAKAQKCYGETYQAHESTMLDLYLFLLEASHEIELEIHIVRILGDENFWKALSPFQAEQLELAIAASSLNATQ